ncbi:MAG: serine O-acetyltransferase EpsC [Bacteriovoracaceae bacterium]
MKGLAQKLFLKHQNKPVSIHMKHVEKFVKNLFALLYPHYTEEVFTDSAQMEIKLFSLKTDLEMIFHHLKINDLKLVDQFLSKLGNISDTLDKDAESILAGDPAARTVDEVILCYPGFFAIVTFRLAHELHSLGIHTLPRMMTEYAHRKTGIDIHPGATIGDYFFIDHGTGIVIGETSHIGKNVKIYQGVTLGALSVKKKLQNSKRHPTIEDFSVIYANATILGGETVIGHHSVIGGSTWITTSVPPHSTILRKES